MPPVEYSDTFYEGPAFALVIGISEYLYPRLARENADPKELEFDDLKFANQDALDFADYLKKNGFIESNVVYLINKEATRAKIKGALENLNEFCDQSKPQIPLVIVYFAGHGMVDNKGRNFLLPHDAEPDNLVGTAIQNREFNDQLNDLDTNRLVVFLDACHGAAMAPGGARDGRKDLYDQEGLGEGSGRYLLASCTSGQKSYEHKEETGKNGIFTDHLLQLLKCETKDFDEQRIEKISISDLYKVLKKKVQDTVKEIYKEKQEPVLKAEGDATGIILAI